MFRTQPRGTHRAPGPAVIDYRGLAAPVGRGVGGVAIVGAVTATAAFSGAESARALTHSPAGIDAMRGVAPALAPSAPTTTYNNVKLRLGARGAAVKHLQTRLNAHGASLAVRSEEHTSELQSRGQLVCRLPLEQKNDERLLRI